MTIKDLREQIENMPDDAEVLLPIPSATEAYLIDETPARGVYLDENDAGDEVVWISTTAPETDDDNNCCGGYRDYEV